MLKYKILLLGIITLFVLEINAQLPQDLNGWTIFTPHSNNRIIYVSSSQGNDATGEVYGATDFADPFLPGAVNAFQTIVAAKAHLRDGAGDWLLFKKGDVWTGTIDRHRTNGVSADFPSLYASYGSGADRPLIQHGDASGIVCFGGGGTPALVEHYAIVGLEFYAHTRDPNNPAFSTTNGGTTIAIFQPGNNILIEDCKIRYGGIAIHTNGNYLINNVKFRRNIVVNNYGIAGQGHAQGAYISDVNNLLIEGCLFDHNGWNNQIPGAHPTIFNHNLYLQYENASNAIVRNNILTRASSHGVQLRSGGLIDNNLFIENPLPVLLGHDSSPNFATGTIQNNVILASKDIDASTPRGTNIWLDKVNGAVVQNNLAANNISHPVNAEGMRLVPPYHNITINNNTFYNVGKFAVSFIEGQSNIDILDNIVQSITYDEELMILATPNQLADFNFGGNYYYSIHNPAQWFRVENSFYDFPSWLFVSGEQNAQVGQITFDAPQQDMAAYHAALGQTASLEAFLAEASLQSKDNWRAEYTTEEINPWFRQGFCSDLNTPTADFSSIELGSRGNNIQVQFTDLSTADVPGITFAPNQWQWDFGDGSTSTQQDPVHDFAPNATYSVSLTVSNDCRSHMVTQTVTVGANLPIEWLFFTTHANANHQVELQWKIATNTPIEYFIIERSFDGKNFSEFQKVAAQSGIGEFQYQAVDKGPQNGLNYYRIRQVAMDGKVTYSEVKVVPFSIKGELVIFPNPAQSEVQVVLKNSVAGQARLLLFDFTGRLVLERGLVIGKERLDYHLGGLGVLSSGLYTLVLEQKNGNYLLERILFN